MGLRGPKSKSPTREEFAAMWSTGTPVEEFVRRYEVSASAVRRWAIKFGLPSRTAIAPSPAESGRLEEFRECWSDPDLTYVDISRRFRARRTTLLKWAATYGLGEKARRDEDGPGPGDPTPEEIEELKAYANARRLMQKGFNFDEGEVVA